MTWMSSFLKCLINIYDDHKRHLDKIVYVNQNLLHMNIGCVYRDQYWHFIVPNKSLTTAKCCICKITSYLNTLLKNLSFCIQSLHH